MPSTKARGLNPSRTGQHRVSSSLWFGLCALEGFQMARKFSGQRLRTLRLAAGLKPERLALAVDVSVWTVHAYERGTVQPSTSVLVALADTLDTTVDSLLTEAVANVA